MKSIMYHYVRPDEPGFPHFRHLHIEDFEKQLDYFRDEYGFVSQPDFWNSLKTGTPVPGVLLTFDDGFSDHYDYVLPALEKRGLWGMFYISSGVYSTKKLLDVHRIHVLLGKYGGRRIEETLRGSLTDEMLSHAHLQEFRELTYLRQSNDAATQTVKRILNYFVSYEHRESVLDRLMAEFFPGEQELARAFYLSPEQLRAMQSRGMVLGSHTVHHFLMSKLNPEEQEREIVESFRTLDELTGGIPQRSFCYPYGGFHSFTADSERLLSKHGSHFSWNVEPREIAESDLKNRPQALPRYDCNQFPFGQVRQST